MKEFDLAAYQRKWSGGAAVLQNIETREKTVEVLVEIDQLAAGGKRYTYAKTAKGTIVYFHEKPDGAGAGQVVDLVYHHFASGIYLTNRGTWCLIVRRHHRSFACGAGNGSHQILSPQGEALQLQDILWLEEVPERKYDPKKESGYFNKKMWWQHDRVYFLSTQIGLIGNRACRVNHPMYIKALRPYVGDQCQISTL